MANMYELFNSVDMDLKEYENQQLSDYELHKLKKDVKKKLKMRNSGSIRKKGIVVAACFCAVFGISTVSAVAGLLPVPESIRNVFGIQSTEQIQLSQDMGRTLDIESVSEGYRITATGVLKDASNICVTYRIEKADGSTLNKDGKDCSDAAIMYLDTKQDWLGGASGIIKGENSPYYIDIYTIFNYDSSIRDNMSLSLQKLNLWFDQDEDEHTQIDGTWTFKIPTDMTDSSIEIASKKAIQLGKNEGTLERLNVSPMGFYFCVTSDEELDQNELITGSDGQMWLYLKNGDKIRLDGASAVKEISNKQWSFIQTGTFDQFITIDEMDKIVLGEYEFKVK